MADIFDPDLLKSAIPDLTAAERNSAGSLTFRPYVGDSGTIDNEAVVYGNESNAMLHQTYAFGAIDGATYDVWSASKFDPYVLLIYDDAGNAIAANSEDNDPIDLYVSGAYYGVDWVRDWVAPYTGTYYVSASWQQDSYYPFYSLTIWEDLDTIAPPDTIAPTISSVSPTDGAVDVPITDSILVTFSEAIQRGTGSITLETAEGITIETFDAQTSSRLSVFGSTLLINPTSDLSNDTHYYVTVTSGSIKDLAGNNYAGTTSYDFSTIGNPDIIGTPGDDVLYDTDGNDTLYGYDGNDILIAYAGNDILYGGPGNDTLMAETGNDVLYGGPGMDGVAGGDGNDILYGEEGDDVLHGGPGDDTINGGAGTDFSVVRGIVSQFQLTQSSGNTYMAGPEGTDTLQGVEYVTFGSSIYSTDVPLSDALTSNPLHLGEQITDLYVAYFNRGPDAEGFDYWFHEIYTGTKSLRTIAEDFAWSDEYRTMYPSSLTNDQFVGQIYQNLFDRSPDQGGWDYWSDRLDAGAVQRSGFILDIIEGAYAPTSGPEDRSLIDNKHDASLYYTGQMSIYPDEGFDNAIVGLLNLVTGDEGTVVSAENVIDYVFDNPITLTGVMTNETLFNFLWADA